MILQSTVLDTNICTVKWFQVFLSYTNYFKTDLFALWVGP